MRDSDTISVQAVTHAYCSIYLVTFGVLSPCIYTILSIHYLAVYWDLQQARHKLSRAWERLLRPSPVQNARSWMVTPTFDRLSRWSSLFRQCKGGREPFLLITKGTHVWSSRTLLPGDNMYWSVKGLAHNRHDPNTSMGHSERLPNLKQILMTSTLTSSRRSIGKWWDGKVCLYLTWSWVILSGGAREWSGKWRCR